MPDFKLDAAHFVLASVRVRMFAFFFPSERDTHWLERSTPLTRFELRALGVWRLTVLVCAVSAMLFAVKSWLLPARNLALERPVEASSKALGTDPKGAVDGNRYGQLGFHSGDQNSAWLAIDLGSETRLSELRIFGRAECCYDQSIPIALELSDDGRAYKQITERTKPFGQYAPWTFKPKVETTARFVRLRTLRKTVLVVSEVEIYGRVL